MRTWPIIALLLLLLAGACFVVYVGWTSTNVEMPPWGYIAMGLGIVFSLLVGFGLMALVFYSSRKGYDEPPKID